MYGRSAPTYIHTYIHTYTYIHTWVNPYPSGHTHCTYVCALGSAEVPYSDLAWCVLGHGTSTGHSGTKVIQCQGRDLLKVSCKLQHWDHMLLHVHTHVHVRTLHVSLSPIGQILHYHQTSTTEHKHTYTWDKPCDMSTTCMCNHMYLSWDATLRYFWTNC